MGLSFSHILILILIFLIFFRPRKISDLTKSIGKAVRNFKESYNEIEVEAKDIIDEPKQKTSLADKNPTDKVEKKI